MADRILVEIAIDLDPVPGVFHTQESAREVIQAMLLDRFPHYNPVVFEVRGITYEAGS